MTESDRADFGSVGGGESLENAPWNAEQDFANQELGETFREEDDEDECCDEGESTHEGLAVSDPFSDDAGDEET